MACAPKTEPADASTATDHHEQDAREQEAREETQRVEAARRKEREESHAAFVASEKKDADWFEGKKAERRSEDDTKLKAQTAAGIRMIEPSMGKDADEAASLLLSELGDKLRRRNRREFVRAAEVIVTISKLPGWKPSWREDVPRAVKAMDAADAECRALSSSGDWLYVYLDLDKRYDSKCGTKEYVPGLGRKSLKEEAPEIRQVHRDTQGLDVSLRHCEIGQEPGGKSNLWTVFPCPSAP